MTQNRCGIPYSVEYFKGILDLPAHLVITGCAFDPSRNTIVLYAVSKEFPVVQEGDVSPLKTWKREIVWDIPKVESSEHDA